ncbi:hypothetical protein CEXT_130211 [Caerostris extrusa]|uniref:Uncharacterized protein n=1 Tax=Caerostris extrusa TaxID=172846 RepID=A0AAV4W1Y8_CAEEX|nr:hypothetical protein CEXT_130211 [Caerostris extrusa]
MTRVMNSAKNRFFVFGFGRERMPIRELKRSQRRSSNQIPSVKFPGKVDKEKVNDSVSDNQVGSLLTSRGVTRLLRDSKTLKARDPLKVFG